MIARTCIAAAALLALAACSEKPQTESGVKSDQPAHAGTGMAFQAPGWKAGDEASWEQKLRVRAQGQNEYVRIN